MNTITFSEYKKIAKNHAGDGERFGYYFASD